LRMQDERPFVTDNFNVIVDCDTGPIADPATLEQKIRAIPGVIDTGLFLGTAHLVVVAAGDSIRELVGRAR
jgi:ribose 5-phosphate isomerase A